MSADPAPTPEARGPRHPLVVAHRGASDEHAEHTLPAYAAALAPAYPHHTVQGTVALWSRFPLREAVALDIRPAAFGASHGLR